MQDFVAARILIFLRAIGLPVREDQISAPTFLPGLTIDRGVLVIACSIPETSFTKPAIPPYSPRKPVKTPTAT